MRMNYAAAMQGTANLFGPDSAIDTLRRGEEAGGKVRILPDGRRCDVRVQW
jgi:hypothetical protein